MATYCTTSKQNKSLHISHIFWCFFHLSLLLNAGEFLFFIVLVSFARVQKVYRQYLQLTGEVEKCQDECLKAMRHHRYRSAQILESLRKTRTLSEGELQQKEELLQKLRAKRTHLDDMAQDLPHSNGWVVTSHILRTLSGMK